MEYREILNLILDNMKSILFPEELLAIDDRFSRIEIISLLLIYRNKEIIMREFSDYISAPMSTATGIADRLEKNGYIMRDRSKDDRRIVLLVLTEEGRKLVEGIIGTLEGFVNGAIESLTREERDMAYSIILKMINGLKKKNSANVETKGQTAFTDIPIE